MQYKISVLITYKNKEVQYTYIYVATRKYKEIN